jgi:tRNA threonylcarbamoyladenosine biosynthesis protein TsaB
MTHILAIDTSTDACSVALLTPSGVYQTLAIAAREHTQRLLPSIDALLKEHHIPLSKLDAIAFCVGPGSFTGLRIALSTAQGLAYGADLPLIPISTLETLACTALRLQLATSGQLIIPSIDARMNEVYWCAYRADDSGNVQAQCDEMISSPDVLADSEWLQIKPNKSEDTNENKSSVELVSAIGSGWHYPCLQAFENSVVIDEVVLAAYPEAYDMALLAEKVYTAGGDKLISPLSAVPTYMRNEISWKKRTRIRATESPST